MRTDEERQQRLSELQHERQATVANITERQDATFPADVQRQYEQNQGGQDLSASSKPDDPTLRSDAEAQVRERNEKEVADAVAPIDAQIKDVGSRSPGDAGHDAPVSSSDTGQKSDDVSHDRDAGQQSSASPDAAGDRAADHSDAVASPSDQGVADSPESRESEPEPEPREESGFESYHEESRSEPEAPAEDHARSSTQHSSYTTGPELSPSALGHLKAVRTPSEQSQPAAAQGEPGKTTEGQSAQSKDPQPPASPQEQTQRGADTGETRVPWSQSPATVTTGAQENPRFETIYPGGEKPYADDGQARTAATDTDRFTSSRLYQAKPGEGEVSHPISDTNAKGRWSTGTDPTQYTPDQLKAMSATPDAPDAIADRRHPQGQTLTDSEAGKNAFGPGGGNQIESRDKREGERNTPRADWNESKQQWDLRPSGIFNRASNPQNFEHEKPAGDRPPSGEGKSAGTASAPPEAASQKSAEAPAKTGPEQAAAPAQAQQAQSQQAQSPPAAQAQPAQAQPAQALAAQAQPAQAQPAQAQPAQAQPVQSQPAQSQSAQSQPAQSQQVPQSQQAQSPATQSQQAPTQSAQPQSAQAQPVQSQQAQSQAQPAQSPQAQSPQAQSPQTQSQAAPSQPGQSQPAQSQSAQAPSGQIAPPSEPNFSAGSGPAPGVKPPSEPNMPAAQSGQAPEVKPPSEPNYSQAPQAQSTPQQAPPPKDHDR
jgi:hypothetical protein